MSAVQPVNPVMRRAILAYDWASSPIGPPDRWPQSLRTVLSLALDTPFAMMIMWGPDLVQLYNDGRTATMPTRRSS